jgi:hypothetical protein
VVTAAHAWIGRCGVGSCCSPGLWRRRRRCGRGTDFIGVMVIRICPNELFPTEFRATAVGISTSVSRFGAAPERTCCRCTDITPSSRRFGRFPASLGG